MTQDRTSTTGIRTYERDVHAFVNGVNENGTTEAEYIALLEEEGLLEELDTLAEKCVNEAPSYNIEYSIDAARLVNIFERMAVISTTELALRRIVRHIEHWTYRRYMKEHGACDPNLHVMKRTSSNLMRALACLFGQEHVERLRTDPNRQADDTRAKTKTILAK